MSSAPPPSSPERGPHSPPPAANGLHVERTGSGPRLVLAHGFTQTGRVWGGMDLDLATDHEVVAVDLPGHGGSAEVVAGLADGARLLVEAGGEATYVGYSMGARHCLQAAVAQPGPVERLVLISGTAGTDSAVERRARVLSDEALADELDPPGGPAATGDTVEVFLRRWLANPLFAGISPEADGFDERLRNTAAGLAASLRLAGTGTQQPLWDRLGRLEMPVLIITGERDDKFTALGRRMAEAIGANATQVVIAGAGHAPHLQRPGQVGALIRRHAAGAGRR